MNMSLLSVETVTELFCLLKLIPAGISEKFTTFHRFYQFFRLFVDFKLSTFITSASNEGDRCESQGMYSWCSQKATQMLPNLIKSFLKPSANATQERCLAFNASSSTDNSSALAHTSCANDQLPFICEHPCTGPTCPAPSICAKNVKSVWKEKYNYPMQLFKFQNSLFDADGKVKGIVFYVETVLCKNFNKYYCCLRFTTIS
jgi:hypothetical protein